jgi:hypothetical protein
MDGFAILEWAFKSLRTLARGSGPAWRAAAEANGLARVRESSFLWMALRLEGWADPLRVVFENAMTGRQTHLRITVSGFASGLMVRPEGFDTRVQKRLGLGGDVETGDETFDRDFLIGGHPPLVHALLDADTRRGLRRLFGGEIEDAFGMGSVRARTTLSAGTLALDFEEDDRDEHLAGVLKTVLDVAQRLVEPADLAARIARNALEDRADGVRRRCVRVLAESQAHAAVTRETLRGACADASEDVRLEAALALAEEGRTVLQELAASAEGEACAARAVAALGSGLGPAAALSLLASSLDRRRPLVAVACMETLGRDGGAGLEAAESVLIERGLHDPEETVRIAAAGALARLGTAAAVLPLQEAAAEAGGVLRRTARDAVAAIQARLGGAAPGQLTITGQEGGALSLATEGGQVSLPGDQPERRV